MKRAVLLVAALGLAPVASGEDAVEVHDCTALNVRAGAGTAHRKLGTVGPGQVYPALSRRGEWIQIPFGREIGWAHQAYLRPVGTPVQVVRAAAAPIHSGPGQDEPVLGRLVAGDRVAVVGSRGEWRRFAYAGQEAWVHAAAARLHDLAVGPRPGDWARPLEVGGFPFVHASTTSGRVDAAHAYSVKPGLVLAGPEVVYRVPVRTPGRLTAWVEGDDDPIDLDVYILSSLDLDGDGRAVAALAQGNEVCEADVTPGTAFVVVETYEGFHRAGPYRLRIDFQPADGWYVRPVAQGVVLKTHRYADLFGARQNGSLLVIDPTAPGVVIKPIAGGCGTVSAQASRAGAVAAVNGGYFNGSCQSVSLLKIDGTLRAPNTKTRTAFGILADGTPTFSLVPAGADWPAATHALGGVMRLLDGGQNVARPGAERSSSAFATGRNPRTAVGVTGRGGVVFGTVDGRTAAGAGMSLDELARWLGLLGVQDALNLDGGGSTSMWVRGEPYGGVVSYPSDDRLPDHVGERSVATVLAVWARPIDRDAVWLTEPPTDAVRRAEPWRYEAVAVDPEGAGIHYRLDGNPPAAVSLIDRGDGTCSLEWVGPSPGAAGVLGGLAAPHGPVGPRAPIRFELVAEVAGSRAVRQAITIR